MGLLVTSESPTFSDAGGARDIGIGSGFKDLLGRSNKKREDETDEREKKLVERKRVVKQERTQEEGEQVEQEEEQLKQGISR